MKRFLPLAALWLMISSVFAQNEVNDSAAGCLACGGGITFMIISLVIFALYVWSIIWVVKDTKARGVDNAILWILLTVFVWPLGPIIYYFVRPKTMPPSV